MPALESVDLTLREGEIVGLVGRNGAGKTTLLRCLMGLLPAGSGEVRLDGRSTRGRPMPEIARRVAYVPQWPSALLFADTLRAELTFTLGHHGLEADPPVNPDQLLAQLGLDHLAERYPRDLSAGELQRAAMAAVLVTRPKVILLDEPTLGMDPIEKAPWGS